MFTATLPAHATRPDDTGAKTEAVIHRVSGESKTITVEAAARELNISRGLAYEGVRTGAIPSIRVGRRVLVPRAALDRLLAGDAA